MKHDSGRLRITDQRIYEALRQIAAKESIEQERHVTIASVAVDILTGKRPPLRLDQA